MALQEESYPKSTRKILSLVHRGVLAVKFNMLKVTTLVSAARWIALIVGGYVLGTMASLVHVPSPHLLAGLLLGASLAISGIVHDRLPRPAYRWVQALVGVMMGSYMDLSSLRTAASSVMPLTAVTAATVVLSIAVA